MRDYTLEHLQQVSQAQKQPYYDMWAKNSALVAAAEIANSSKHFGKAGIEKLQANTEPGLRAPLA
jgi:hypothetical protein